MVLVVRQCNYGVIGCEDALLKIIDLLIEEKYLTDIENCNQSN